MKPTPAKKKVPKKRNAEPMIEIVKLKINTEEAFTEPLIRLDEVKYLLKEERRIFKNEVHYFDHPKIGIIISVYSSL